MFQKIKKFLIKKVLHYDLLLVRVATAVARVRVLEAIVAKGVTASQQVPQILID